MSLFSEQVKAKERTAEQKAQIQRISSKKNNVVASEPKQATVPTRSSTTTSLNQMVETLVPEAKMTYSTNAVNTDNTAQNKKKTSVTDKILNTVKAASSPVMHEVQVQHAKKNDYEAPETYDIGKAVSKAVNTPVAVGGEAGVGVLKAGEAAADFGLRAINALDVKSKEMTGKLAENIGTKTGINAIRDFGRNRQYEAIEQDEFVKALTDENLIDNSFIAKGNEEFREKYTYLPKWGGDVSKFAGELIGPGMVAKELGAIPKIGRYLSIIPYAFSMGGEKQQQEVNAGVDSDEAFKQGLRTAGSTAIFGEVMAVASPLVNKGAQTLLNKTPYAKNIVANVATKYLAETGTGIAAGELANIPLKDEDKRDLAEIATISAVFAGINTLGSTLQLAKNMKGVTENFEKDFTAKFNDAYSTTDSQARAEKFTALKQELNDVEDLLKQNKIVFGKDNVTTAVEDVIKPMQSILDDFIATSNYTPATNLLSGGMSSNVQNSLYALSAPTNVPQAQNTANSLVPYSSPAATQNMPNSNIALAGMLKGTQNNPSGMPTLEELIPIVKNVAQNDTQDVRNKQVDKINQAENKTVLSANMEQSKQNLIKDVENNKYLNEQEKKSFIDTINEIEYTEDVEKDVRRTMNVFEEERGLKNITNNFNETKPTYNKYTKDNVEYDKQYIDLAKDSVKANNSGKRTKEQWLQVAKNLGNQIYEMSDAEVEKQAFKSWIDNRPNNADVLNRQGKKYVKFTMDEWVNQVYDTVREARKNVPQQVVENKAPQIATEKVQNKDTVYSMKRETPKNQASNLKQKQLDIVKATNPMTDDYHTGIRSVKDIKSFEETLNDDESFTYGDFTKEDALKAIEKGEVKVYSSKPITNGGFVSTSYNMAKDYAGSGKVYSETVPLTDVAWINGDEGQLARVEYTDNQKLEINKNELKNIIAAVEKGSKNIEYIITSNAVKQTEEIMKSIPETYLIDDEERVELREIIAQDIYDKIINNVSKDKIVDIIIGPPAAGKSTIADKYIKKHNAALLDSDMIKEQLPEFQGGIGANAVQEESSMIAEQIRQDLMNEGYNFVYPIVGKNLSSLKNKINELKSTGYTVNLILNELPTEKTLLRALKRYIKTGRYLSPEYIKSVGLKPSENYDKIKLEGKIGGVDNYERYSNDVEYGEPAKQLESFREKRKTSRGKKEVEHEIYSRDDKGNRETSPREPLLDVGKRIEYSKADGQSAFSMPENTEQFIEQATEKDIAELQKIVDEAKKYPDKIDLQFFAKKAQSKLQELKQKSQNAIDVLREGIKKGTAEQSNVTDVVNAEREVAKERLNEAKEHYSKLKEAEKGRRDRATAEKDLLKIVRKLDKLKTTPDNKAAINDLIGDIDTVARGISEKGKLNLETLKAEYEKLQEDNPDFIPNNQIEKKISRLDRKQISDMELEDIRDLTDVLRGINHDIQTAKKEIAVEKAREIYKIGETIISEIQSSKGSNPKTKGGKLGQIAKKTYTTSTLSPKRFFKKIGGGGNNEFAKQYQQLEEGQTKQIDFRMRATKKFDDFVKKYEKEMGKWSGKKAEFIDIDPNTRITKDMRMSLYLHSKNAKNLKHIVNGGLRIPEETLYKLGQYKEAYSRGKILKVTPSMIKDITSKMSAEEKEFADLAYDFFNNDSKKAINDTSVNLVGYELATEPDYFPINTDKNYTRGEFESLTHDGTIEGMGMLKERTNSTIPVVLEDLTDVVLRQIDNVSKYYGMAIPLRNFNKVYNVTTKGYENSVKDVISQKWGNNATEYIEKLITDLQVSKKQHSVLDTLKGNFAQATLAFNPGVTLKQVASYPTAAAELGWDALRKGLVRAAKRPEKGEALNNLIDKYTPYYWYRRMGNSTVELGDATKDKTLSDKLPWAMNWIQSADMVTTGPLLWSASEEYVLANKPNLKEGTDEFYQEVAKIYNRTILDTQPNYTVLQRPDILRSDSSITRSLTMFQTQRMQNYNIFIESCSDYAKAKARYKSNPTQENKEELDNAFRKLVNSTTGLIVAALAITGIDTGVDFLLGRNEKYQNKSKEYTAWNVTKGVGKNFLSSMTGNILWGSEIFNFIWQSVTKDKSYYGLEAPNIELINDFVDTCSSIISNIPKALKEKKAVYLYKPLNELAKEIASIYGIPLSNAEKYLNAIVSKIFPEFGTVNNMLYNYSKNENLYDKYFNTAKKENIKANDFMKAYEIQKGIKGEKDENGKTISNSAGVKKKDAIDELLPGYNQKQKETLYEAFGVSEKVWSEAGADKVREKMNSK